MGSKLQVAVLGYITEKARVVLASGTLAAQNVNFSALSVPPPTADFSAGLHVVALQLKVHSFTTPSPEEYGIHSLLSQN